MYSKNLQALSLCLLLTALFSGVLIAQTPIKNPTNAIDKVKDLVGKWSMKSDGGYIVEEWQLNDCNEITGQSRTVNNGKITIAEELRLSVFGDKVVYIASPFGQTPTLFLLTECNSTSLPKSWKFENKEHDFPQTLLYEMTEENKLKVTVSGKQKKKVQSFVLEFTR